MTKVQLKSDNINPFGDIFASIFVNHLCGGDCIDLDFDYQFNPDEKKDARYSYEKADGYFPSVAPKDSASSSRERTSRMNTRKRSLTESSAGSTCTAAS